MQDKDAFLQAHYTTEQLAPGVVARIKSGDGKAMSFNKASMTVTPHIVTSTGETDKIAKENLTKFTAGGGGLLMAIEEDKSNDVTGTTTFSTTYRGFLNLRSQWFTPSNTLGTMAVEIKEFTEFPDVSALKPNSQVAYRYTFGTVRQSYNFKKYAMTCKTGEEIAASTVNPKLEGGAFKMSCQVTDEVGAVTGNYENVYLMNYGFAVPYKRLGSDYTTNFEVKDLQFY